jgi:hypothetical protein
MSARSDDAPVFPGAGRRPATPRQGGGPPWTPLAALAALLLAACAPAIDFGRATTLAAGEVRYSGGAELSILAADLRPDQPVPLPWANLSAGVHAGLTDRVEVGGRAWGFGWPGLFTTFGLAAAVWTRDIARAHEVAKRLRAGTVWVNCYDVFDAAAPFGGFKQSGFGRELGERGLDSYLETKTVTVSLDPPGA